MATKAAIEYEIALAGLVKNGVTIRLPKIKAAKPEKNHNPR